MVHPGKEPVTGRTVVLPRAKVPRPGLPDAPAARALVLNPSARRVSWQAQAAVLYALAGPMSRRSCCCRRPPGCRGGNQQLEQIIIDPAQDAPGYDPGQAGCARPARDGADDPGGQRRGGDAARRAGTARKGPRAHQGARHPAGHKRIAPDRHGL